MKPPEITVNLYFWVYKAQMNMDLFFDHYFNFLSVKTNKKGIKIIYPQGSKTFKPQIPVTRLAMWLNDFEFDVI